MCGLAAVFSRAPAADLANRMGGFLAHRGPDDAGGATMADIQGRSAGYLSHRRLAVLDLTTAGHQPMVGAGGLTVAYNGEIYNFRELRRDLRARGCAFSGDSDTEVLLAGWNSEGPAFLSRLRGMFAFVLWDARVGRGYLARDRFGIKPLYLTERPGCIAVASEVGALVRAGAVPSRISGPSLASYLACGSVAEPGTIVAGVRSLAAGAWLEVCFTPEGPVAGPEHQYASVQVRTAGHTLECRPAVAGDRVRSALRDSVAAHLVSDVEIGVFLSGGIDSAALVALASEVSGQSLRTFTIGFAEQAFSEATAAAAIARRFGAPHEELRLSDADILGSLDQAFMAMDQPSMDGLNVYYVSQAVRARGIKVALSGLGGDELFAGYPSFARARRSAPLWGPHVPNRLRRVASAIARRGTGLRSEKAALWLDSPTPAAGAYRGSRALFGPRAVDRLGSSGAPALASPPAGTTVGGEVSWYELTGYMRNTLLRDADVFSMAHGLELRVPFVDDGIAAAVAEVDESVLAAGSGPKPLLALALRDLLPPELWQRPKRGFTLPFALWLRGRLRAAVEAEFQSDGPSRCGISHAAALDVWRAFERGQTTWSRPWALYTLFRWVREHDATLAGVGAAT